MDTDRYDIFLSYRRKGGFETAKHLFDLLTRDGYSVSFDIDTLRSGDFDTALLGRIDQCTDFILILDREAFDRTLDPAFERNKDWLRIELAYALEKGRNIIPVMLSGFTEFPDNLPADIAAVERKNGPKYDQYYFDAFYAKLLRFLDSRPVERRRAALSGEPAAGSSTLKIKSDTDCRIFVDDEERGTARAGSLFRLPLRGGSYILRFVSVENAADAIEETCRIEKDVEELYVVALAPVRQQREEREAAEERRRREAYLLQLPDDRFVGFKDNSGKYGFSDRENQELLIPANYDYAYAFSEGLASVRKDGKYGYIDKSGKEIIPFIYDNAYAFSEGLACVRKQEKWGYIDKSGKTVIPIIYDDAGSFRGGLAKVKKTGIFKQTGKWGYIDKSGKEVVPFIYDYAYSFSEGLAAVEKDRKYGYIDKSGKEVISFIYDHAYSFSESLAAVKKNGMFKKVEWLPNMDVWGYIDKSGKTVIPIIYDYAYSFSEGLAAVNKDRKWGYLDKSGKTVIPFIYDGADSFRKGLAKVEKDGKEGYIDKSGRWVKDA